MSLWQIQSWQDMLITSGQTQEYFIIELDIVSSSLNQGRIEIGGSKTKIFVEKRRVSLGEYGLFVIGFEGQITKEISENLWELCREENCLFAQIETLDYSLVSSSLLTGDQVNCESREYTLEQNGERYCVEKEENGDASTQGYYKKFIPPYSAVIDLTQSEEMILANMKPKGRYNIKLAEKKAVKVEQVDKNPHNAKIFFELMQETSSRDHFAGNSLEYYTSFLEKIEESQLFFAYFEEKVIAAGIFVTSDSAMLYYYGASSNAHRNLMAPYLLQWTAIQHAQKRGLLLYDFLGIASPGDQASSLLGVTDFKLKFTPDVREVSKSFLYIQKPWKYSMIQVFRKVRRK